MALDITLILVIAFFYVGIAFNYDVPGASGKGLQDFSLPVVNLFSEGIQNVSISGL
jgi:hypothetical protein